MSIKVRRHLHLVGAVGQIRTATYDNREHLVVPVVAMVEGVVWASNSDVPEFVPAEELAETPYQWNGRGCFAGHPEDGGTQITANTPRTLEKSFGLVFDAVDSQRILRTRRLEMCAWLDPVKAEAIGPAAADVVRRLRAVQNGEPGAKPVEVSVGCYVEAEDVDGEWNGRAYHGIWRNIVSDHLAFLSTNEEGACSVKAGCGAGRAASRHLIVRANDIVSLQVLDRNGKPLGPKATFDRGTNMPAPKPVPKRRMKAGSTTETEPNPDYVPPVAPKRGLKERFASFLSSMRDAEINESDRDLRYKIDAALRAVEPGYMGVSDVFPDGTDDMTEPHVVYDVMPADEWMMFRRGYTVAGDNVTLGPNPERIEAVTTYQSITNAAAQAAKPCSCGGQQARGAVNQPAKEAVMKESVKKVIAESGGKYTDADATWMDNIPEAHLQTLAVKPTPAPAAAPAAIPDAAIAPVAAAAVPAAEQPKAAEAKALTRTEIFAADPSIKSIVEQHEAREAAEKTELIAKLKVASSVMTEEQLKAEPIERLRTLAAFAKVETPTDHSGRGAVVPPKAPAGTENYAPPNAYDKDLRVMRGEKAIEKPTVN